MHLPRRHPSCAAHGTRRGLLAAASLLLCVPLLQAPAGAQALQEGRFAGVPSTAPPAAPPTPNSLDASGVRAPSDAPRYLRRTYPAALKAPLPAKISSRGAFRRSYRGSRSTKTPRRRGRDPHRAGGHGHRNQRVLPRARHQRSLLRHLPPAAERLEYQSPEHQGAFQQHPRQGSALRARRWRRLPERRADSRHLRVGLRRLQG